MKVLVVDPDPRIRKLLERILSIDHIVDFADTADKAEILAYSGIYEIVLLSKILPDMDGEDLCGLIKARMPGLPVIVISQMATVADKEAAFEKGADDYMVRPFSPRELKARMRAATRRYTVANEIADYLQLGDLHLDRARRQVKYKEERLNIRKKEMQLLEFLMANRGRVVTKGEILENVWDMNVNPFTNTVEVHVKRLRDRIERPFGLNIIKTVHGIGYLVE